KRYLMCKENNMEIPVKNKEELDENDKFVVSKLKYKIAIYSAIFSFLGLVITSLIPLAKEIFTNEQQIILKKVEEQQKITAILDSISRLQKEKELRQTFEDIDDIYEQLGRLKYLLPKSASITIYSSHDSGGVPKSGSPLHVTVLYEVLNGEGNGSKEYWQQKPMPEGYFQFARNIYDRG